MAKLVESLRYKPEGRGFDSPWRHLNFSLTLSACNKNEYQEYFLGEGGAVFRANNLTTFMCRSSWNLGASTSCTPYRLSRPVMGLLYLFTLNNYSFCTDLTTNWHIIPILLVGETTVSHFSMEIWFLDIFHSYATPVVVWSCRSPVHINICNN